MGSMPTRGIPAHALRRQYGTIYLLPHVVGRLGVARRVDYTDGTLPHQLFTRSKTDHELNGWRALDNKIWRKIAIIPQCGRQCVQLAAANSNYSTCKMTPARNTGWAEYSKISAEKQLENLVNTLWLHSAHYKHDKKKILYSNRSVIMSSNVCPTQTAVD